MLINIMDLHLYVKKKKAFHNVLVTFFLLINIIESIIFIIVRMIDEGLNRMDKQPTNQPTKQLTNQPSKTEIVTRSIERLAILAVFAWFINVNMELPTYEKFIPMITFIMGMIFRHYFGKD